MPQSAANIRHYRITEELTMKTLGLQLFTIRDNFKDEETIKESFKKMAEIGYGEAQTAGLFISPEKFAEYAKDAGVKICGTHYGWEDIRDRTDETMKIHEILGTTNIGIGGMPGYARESKEGMLKFIDEANEVAAKIAKHGFKFTYHNHSFEFKKFDGKTMMDYLIDGFDKDNVSFVLDTYWVQHGGASIAEMIERLAGRIDILHLKDMGACGGENHNVPYITEIGNGNINFKTIVPLAEKTGVKSFVVEQDSNWKVSPFDSIKESYDKIKSWGLID